MNPYKVCVPTSIYLFLILTFWICASKMHKKHGMELALLSDYILCCVYRWWNEATWNPCRFFLAVRSILILLILHHTDMASLNRNLFFLLRFFLSNLSRGNLNCLDMALNLTHTHTYSHCHKHSYVSSHTLLPSHLLRCFVCFIPILQ